MRSVGASREWKLCAGCGAERDHSGASDQVPSGVPTFPGPHNDWGCLVLWFVWRWDEERMCRVTGCGGADRLVMLGKDRRNPRNWLPWASTAGTRYRGSRLIQL